MNNKVIYFWMSCAMITWAVAWTNAKIVNEYLSFYNLTFFRFLLGSFCLLPFIKKYKYKDIVSSNALSYLTSASILFFIYNIAFFMGTHFGLSGKGAVFVTTVNPIITVIIMTIINKKIKTGEILGICLGVIGGLSILGVFTEGFIIIKSSHNIYFLICAITWGLMTVVANYGQKKMDPLLFIFCCYLITSIIALPFTDFSAINFKLLDFRFYFNFFMVSIGAMAFGTSIYLYYTPILGPVKVSVFIFSVPFLALLTANIFLSELITTEVIIGGILSLFAIYTVNRK